ncbi:hypothetical protein JOB18_003830 [Solea senegalensis]|uniref:Uncharacterized protein n=1 Tax=Solea senegalensis TaxID=28829 RepID=A0AAV6QVG1_SOLSE|nr:hypothetical protein JOB18_003830 [Solea senegalensis]
MPDTLLPDSMKDLDDDGLLFYKAAFHRLYRRQRGFDSKVANHRRSSANYRLTSFNLPGGVCWADSFTNTAEMKPEDFSCCHVLCFPLSLLETFSAAHRRDETQTMDSL